MTSTTLARTAPGPRRRARGLAVVGAVLAAAAVWVVAVVLLGVGLTASTGGSSQEVGLIAVVGASLLACLVGWGLLAVLERFTRRAALVWTAVAVVVVLVSMLGPLTSGAGAAGTAVFVLLHLVPAVVLVPVMRRTSPTA